MKDFKKRAKQSPDTMQQLNSGFEGGGKIKTTIGEELDDAGFQTSGYITKKNLTVGGDGAMAHLNYLPPGPYIDNQVNADIRPLEVKYVTEMGYPGDGWSGKSDDMGI